MNRSLRKIFFSLEWLFIFILTACSDSKMDISYDANQNTQQNKMNEVISVCDKNGDVIVDIEHFGAIVQTDNGFIYSSLSLNSAEEAWEMEYYQYDFSTNKSIPLGVISEWVYEASYDTICNGSHVYMLVTVGDSYDFDKTVNYLYDIDLQKNTMEAIILKNSNSPYNSMTLAGDKIFVVTPGREKCYVNEYDTKSKSLVEIKEYSFDSKTNTGETIRHISSDEYYIYLLRLNMNTETNVQMYIDCYDWSMELVSSMDVTAVIAENTLETEDENNELRQLVSHFDVNNGYVYYENFSITRALFELSPVNTGNISNPKNIGQAVSVSPEFFRATNAMNNNALVTCYEAYKNNIFILNTDTGQINQYSFFANDKDYYITYMTQNSKEDILIFVNYKDPETSETLPSRMYFMNVSDFEKG